MRSGGFPVPGAEGAGIAHRNPQRRTNRKGIGAGQRDRRGLSLSPTSSFRACASLGICFICSMDQGPRIVGSLAQSLL